MPVLTYADIAMYQYIHFKWTPEQVEEYLADKGRREKVHFSELLYEEGMLEGYMAQLAPSLGGMANAL